MFEVECGNIVQCGYTRHLGGSRSEILMVGIVIVRQRWGWERRQVVVSIESFLRSSSL